MQEKAQQQSKLQYFLLLKDNGGEIRIELSAGMEVSIKDREVQCLKIPTTPQPENGALEERLKKLLEEEFLQRKKKFRSDENAVRGCLTVYLEAEGKAPIFTRVNGVVVEHGNMDLTLQSILSDIRNFYTEENP